MGLLKDSFKVVGEIVTFGGVGRLEAAKKKYEALFDQYELLRGDCERLQAQSQACLQAIGTAVTHARSRLQIAEGILGRRERTLGDVSLGQVPAVLQEIHRFQTGFSAAANIGSGAAAGSAAGIGAWAVVTTFGAASTGTAISTLGGVAATNATLAWFGGGALAAGGAGVAGGTAVLGGIVALPLLYVAGRGLHKKAAEIEKEIPKLQRAIKDGHAHVIAAREHVAQLETARDELTRHCNTFSAQVDRLSALIIPWGMWSKWKQALLRFLRRPAYSPEVLQLIHILDEATMAFMAEFNGKMRGDTRSQRS